MTNIFRSLSTWFSGGTEDFFTAALASFLERNEILREEFLNWVSEYVRDDLHQRRWTIKAQVPRPSIKGVAIIDMELRSPDLILWFEHKIGAGLGKYGDIDQIEKYLDAANRVMLGVEEGLTSVEWPQYTPNGNCPRVVLFYITRDSKSMESSRYAGRIYSGGQRFGLAWVPPNGHLRWRAFWSPAQRALDAALDGELGEFERTLSRQFLRYWRSIPGMWKQMAAGDEWTDLIPADWKDLPEGQSCGFDELWDDVRRIAKERLHCGSITPYRGYSQTLEFAPDVCPQVDKIEVYPISDVATLSNYDDRLGPYVLRLLFRRRENQNWPSFRSEATFEDRWTGRMQLHRVGSAKQLEILVGIPNWEECRDAGERRSAVGGAFWASIKIGAIEAGVEFLDVRPSQ